MTKIKRNDESLKDIKQKISDSQITYDEIACVLQYRRLTKK